MYKIIGQDGKEYGPVSAGQIRKWIAENRLEQQTPIFADGATDWNFVGLMPEFAGLFPGNPPTIAPPKPGTTRTNSFALAGLILGIVSLTVGLCCCYGFPLNILGLIFSIVALSELNHHPQSHDGRSLAIAGVILCGISILLAISLAIFGLVAGGSHVMLNFRQF